MSCRRRRIGRTLAALTLAALTVWQLAEANTRPELCPVGIDHRPHCTQEDHRP